MAGTASRGLGGVALDETLVHQAGEALADRGGGDLHGGGEIGNAELAALTEQGDEAFVGSFGCAWPWDFAWGAVPAWVTLNSTRRGIFDNRLCEKWRHWIIELFLRRFLSGWAKVGFDGAAD